MTTFMINFSWDLSTFLGNVCYKILLGQKIMASTYWADDKVVNFSFLCKTNVSWPVKILCFKFYVCEFCSQPYEFKNTRSCQLHLMKYLRIIWTKKVKSIEDNLITVTWQYIIHSIILTMYELMARPILKFVARSSTQHRYFYILELSVSWSW